jgi:hypothetical protein
MSPRFYSYLWTVFFLMAGIMWLMGTLSMIAVVVLGFVAFGLVFTGMMCVLPSAVSHPAPAKKVAQRKEAVKASPARASANSVSGISYRPV